MEFIHLLNESTVTYVKDMWASGASGWEAISPFGEIKQFSTYERAQAWRLAEVRTAYNLAFDYYPKWAENGDFIGYFQRGI